MSNLAISVENLSKCYRIGLAEKKPDSLREAISSFVGAPFRYLRTRLRKPGSDELVWALKDVSFEVKHGEVLGIIGRNGAGKSTLLKILSRITEPTEGRAKVYGRVGSLLEVGTGFHPELTGRENIYLNGTILGMRRVEIERRFDEIVDFSGVEKFLDTPVKRYSSGMYVRLAFAVAAHLDPEILLVDEVLAVGDAMFQKKCLGKMGTVAKEGRTVLLVSHNMGSIKQLCPRAILLSTGEIQKIGRTPDVISCYLAEEFNHHAAEYSWNESNAPGDEAARLKTMRVCSVTGEPRSEFGTDEPICVEVKYTILKKLPLFRIGLSLYNDDGNYIFYSSDSDITAYAGQPREPGVCVSRCQIPASWLNVGSYYFVVSGGMFGIRPVFSGLPQLGFTVISTGGPTSQFNEKRAGLLCPILPWKIEYIGQNGC